MIGRPARAFWTLALDCWDVSLAFQGGVGATGAAGVVEEPDVELDVELGVIRLDRSMLMIPLLLVFDVLNRPSR